MGCQNLDYNYLYYLVEKTEKEECPSYRSVWLEQLKEHILFLDMQGQKSVESNEDTIMEKQDKKTQELMNEGWLFLESWPKAGRAFLRKGAQFIVVKKDGSTREPTRTEYEAIN